ncbi:alkaline phosphatase family protein [Roseateles amylovorans]|uniref:Alkaline phosphatase family protein n=1 Tax=Roseateles amylovorans TaxID=2978473 RepID=A0ABY6B1F8_9BURK|nr:alkaline phosphatase family protein [Roseateles amylovorans]UXH78998.1 alkaline phosphatase family protein [Roseateles amylovorans]
MNALAREVPPGASRSLVVLLADGLRADTARDYMGYLQALKEAGRAQWSSLRCELPSLSRPLYATVINGEPPLSHGILGNGQAGERLSRHLFQALAHHGVPSAVAAYHWFYELLAGERFDPLQHRDAIPPGCGITAARWYWEDDYPDSHLLADAESLRRSHLPRDTPSLLFIHPMGPDLAGHLHGGESTAYAMSARKLDMLLAQCLPRWHAAGYDLLLTSDHGMHADRMHGGPLAVEREVPLVWAPHDAGSVTMALPDQQTGVAGWILARLGVHDWTPGAGAGVGAGVGAGTPRAAAVPPRGDA